MKPIEASELLNLVEYEKAREAYVARMIQCKRSRRVSVGDDLTFIFENRETVRFQIQEMLRAERLVDGAAIQAELDVYNELLPGDHELSATLMIEIEESSRIRETLNHLVGIDEHVQLEIGGSCVRATFDPKHFEEERISAVQYVRFPLRKELAERFPDPAVPAILRVAHPLLTASAPIEGSVRASLCRDLDPHEEPPLLP